MKQRVNLQRSITDENDLKLLNEVELEIAKMKMLQLNAACAAEEQQREGAGERSAVSRMRWLVMQMLQFPVPRHSFAPNLGMMEMYADDGGGGGDDDDDDNDDDGGGGGDDDDDDDDDDADDDDGPYDYART